MPEKTPRNIDTPLSDRALLVHILEHVEHFTAVLEEFRPLLDLLRGPDGKIDMIGAASLRRRARRGNR
jgi:hypothetical protein